MFRSADRNEGESLGTGGERDGSDGSPRRGNDSPAPGRPDGGNRAGLLVPDRLDPPHADRGIARSAGVTRRRAGGSASALRRRLAALRASAPARLSTLGTSAGLLVGGVLTSVMASRALGVSGRGEYVTWQAWSTSVAVFALGGLPQVMVLDRRREGRHRFREVLPPFALTFTVAAVALVLVFTVRESQPVVVPAALLLVAANQTSAIAIAEAQRMGRIGGEFNLARLAPPLAAIAAMVALLMVGTSSATAWMSAVALAQATVIGLWLTVAIARGPAVPGTAARLTRETVRLAPGHWSTLGQYRVDLLAITLLFPPSTVALYAVGVAAQAAVFAAGQSGGIHWFARRDENLRYRQTQLSRELVRTALIALAVTVPLTGSAEIWVPALYGEAFSPAVPLVVILCGVGVLQSVDFLLNHECLLSGQGRRLAWYRMPALATLMAGFGWAKLAGWPVTASALLPAAGYLVSVVTLLMAQRRAARGPGRHRA